MIQAVPGDGRALPDARDRSVLGCVGATNPLGMGTVAVVGRDGYTATGRVQQAVAGERSRWRFLPHVKAGDGTFSGDGGISDRIFRFLVLRRSTADLWLA